MNIQAAETQPVSTTKPYHRIPQAMKKMGNAVELPHNLLQASFRRRAAALDGCTAHYTTACVCTAVPVPPSVLLCWLPADDRFVRAIRLEKVIEKEISFRSTKDRIIETKFLTATHSISYIDHRSVVNVLSVVEPDSIEHKNFA